MRLFGINISMYIIEFLNKFLGNEENYEVANERLFVYCGVLDFFDSQENYALLKAQFANAQNIYEEPDRTEYGDFQTNDRLAQEVSLLLKEQVVKPNVIVEPTCGKGAFILTAISNFDSANDIYGVEVYKPYIWEAKFRILGYYLSNPDRKRYRIHLIHFNVFDYDFSKIAKDHFGQAVLIIGNPPWVTNSKLSSLNSNNLPEKSNFKGHTGFDAITGKGNFDIGEFITLKMFDAFQNSNGNLAFLVKNTVIKNIVYDQKERHYKVCDFAKYSIDCKREFDVSVEAALFTCKLNNPPSYQCKEYDFYNNGKLLKEFGWIEDKFVSDIAHYKHSKDIDGTCQFEWRQGVKHDLSAIMEFDKVNDHYVNGKGQNIYLEDDLVYPMLKSSDLKKTVINATRKFTIITQRKVGEETLAIKERFPLTFNYLTQYKEHFDSRKSSIYKNKPPFSIFGIGDYSFKPFKVAISGLYKNYCFNLILPDKGKSIMLDDTCYFIGFDKLEFAAYTLVLLNTEKVRELLQAITFSDAKRTFTKDVLMRIDLAKFSTQISGIMLAEELTKLSADYSLNLGLDSWEQYLKLLHPTGKGQIKMFG